MISVIETQFKILSKSIIENLFVNKTADKHNIIHTDTRNSAAIAYTMHSKDKNNKKPVLSQRNRAIHFCFAILIQYQYDRAIKVRSSDINRGVACQNYGLRPGLPLVFSKFLYVLLGVGG